MKIRILYVVTILLLIFLMRSTIERNKLEDELEINIASKNKELDNLSEDYDNDIKKIFNAQDQYSYWREGFRKREGSWESETFPTAKVEIRGRLLTFVESPDWQTVRGSSFLISSSRDFYCAGFYYYVDENLNDENKLSIYRRKFLDPKDNMIIMSLRRVD